MKKYLAEMVGTMVLVLMGCGSAVFAGNIAAACGAGVGTLGVAMAFGLSVIAMAYTIGGISGCHINPAITLGVWLSKRMNGKDAAMYMVFQIIGAIIGSSIIYALVSTGGSSGVTTYPAADLLLPLYAAAYHQRQCLSGAAAAVQGLQGQEV